MAKNCLDLVAIIHKIVDIDISLKTRLYMIKEAYAYLRVSGQGQVSGSGLEIPQAQMFEYFLDDLFTLDDGDDTHIPLVSSTNKTLQNLH